MEPGYRIEHYMIIEKIGQGGQAAVWSAYDERLKRTVAIKTIGLSQFLEGASVTGGTGTAPAGASSLTNPNILPVYAFGQEGDSLYIVMRYMASGSLKDLLKKEPISAERAAFLLEPLAGALDLAHQNQIIHRDIKSANILLDAQLHPYLADFGLSMTKGDMSSQAGVGTLAYMSPEQMMGDPLDQRSDLYAFGILAFELIVGKLPMVDGQPWNLRQTMSEEPLPVPDFVPQAVKDVLVKSTAMQPDDRYQSATEMITELRRAVAGTTPAQAAAPEPAPVITDPAKLALIGAHDLFNRAQERWSDGAGRFRFEAGDYKYVDGFYSNPDDWAITLNPIAERLMLRAALEHGYNLDYWWNLINDVDDRRAVTLQTLTSEIASARMRAMERLVVQPDSSPPAIPIRVANVLAEERDPGVKLAGIKLLESRATPDKAWRPMAYTEVIDGALVTLAASDPDPRVAEAAARACARLRSTFAVTQLGTLATGGDVRALRALTYIRDEVPNLPGVPLNVRSRVFAALSWRQLVANPMQLVGRFIGAALAAGLAIGGLTYVQFNDQNGLLAAQRFGNALAVGALYGLLVGFGIFVTVELARRLRAWNPIGRIILALAVGTLTTTVAFVIFDRFFRFYTPNTQLVLLWCLIFVSGFAIAAGLTRRTWILSIAGTLGVVAAIWFSWQNGQEPLFYLFDGADDQSLIFSLLAGLSFGILTFLPELISGLRQLMAGSTTNNPSA